MKKTRGEEFLDRRKFKFKPSEKDMRCPDDQPDCEGKPGYEIKHNHGRRWEIVITPPRERFLSGLRGLNNKMLAAWKHGLSVNYWVKELGRPSDTKYPNPTPDEVLRYLVRAVTEPNNPNELFKKFRRERKVYIEPEKAYYLADLAKRLCELFTDEDYEELKKI
jgi:hypothetical protein